MQFYAEWVTLFSKQKCILENLISDIKSFEKPWKNRMLEDRFLLVFSILKSQVTLDNDESYRYCLLMITLRNKIAVDPPGFETKRYGHQLRKRLRMTIFHLIFTSAPVPTRGKHCKRSEVRFPHQLAALFPMVKSKRRPKIHQVPAILSVPVGLLLNTSLFKKNFHVFHHLSLPFISISCSHSSLSFSALCCVPVCLFLSSHTRLSPPRCQLKKEK